MSYAFSESINMVMPGLGEDYASHTESATTNALIVEIAAIHEGLTANYNMYSAKELEASLETWVNPYPRPVITNHDIENEALGRIMAAKIENDKGLTTIMLQAAIADKQAIEKYRDKRYLTGSVGGKAESAICNICETDWAKSTGFELPCEHKRGTIYKGKVAHLEMKGINWKEYSMVNTPADSQSISTVKSDEDSSSDDGWTRAQIFSVDMNKESIVCFGESGSYDILKNKKRKEAIPLYHNTRGAFLSAFSVGEDDQDYKETAVSGTELENDDNILDVVENLSDALADEAPTPVEDGDADQTADATDAVDAPEADATDTPEAADVDTDTPAAEGDTPDDAAADEGDKPEDDAADSADKADEDKPEDDAPAVDAPAEDDTPEAPTADENSSVDDSPKVDDEPAESDSNVDTELAQAQERNEELSGEVARLTAENEKLKSALKKGLAERVVDLKIDLGLEEADNRSTLIEEHVSRSAASLADSMVDLRKLPIIRPAATEDLADLFVKESGSTSVKSDKRVTMTVADEDASRKSDPSEQLEDIVVAGLLGKRQL